MPSCQRERGANTDADTDPGEETGGTMDQEADDVPGDGPGDRATADRTEGEEGCSKHGLAAEIDGLGGGEANSAG